MIFTLSRTLNELTKPIFDKFGFYYFKIITDWHLIVGENLAKLSSPIRISKVTGKEPVNVLHIEVYNSSAATELYYLQDIIIEKIAIFFGYKVIDRVKFIQKPKRFEPLQEQTKGELKPDQLIEIENKTKEIEDKELKEALFSLGSSIKLNR